MSIRVMTRVWEHSHHKGNALLLLLAIADHADDDGAAFPGIKSLSRKARVGETTCHRLLKTLERSGELAIESGAGRISKYGTTNLYRVTMAEQTTLPGATVGTGPKMAPGAIDALRGAKSAPLGGANRGTQTVPTNRHIETSSRARMARGAGTGSKEPQRTRTGMHSIREVLNSAQARARSQAS